MSRSSIGGPGPPGGSSGAVPPGGPSTIGSVASAPSPSPPPHAHLHQHQLHQAKQAMQMQHAQVGGGASPAVAAVAGSGAPPASSSAAAALSASITAERAFLAQLSSLLAMCEATSPLGDQQSGVKILCEFITTSSRGPPAAVEVSLEVIAREFAPTFHRFLTTRPAAPPAPPAGSGANSHAAAAPRHHPPSLILHIVQALALLSRPMPSSSAPASGAQPTMQPPVRILRIMLDEFGLLPILLDLLLGATEKRLIESLLALLTHVAKHRVPGPEAKAPAEHIAAVTLDKLLPFCLLHSSDAIKGNTLALIAALLEHYLALPPPPPPVLPGAGPEGVPNILAAAGHASPNLADRALPSPVPVKNERDAFMEELLAKRNLLYFLAEMREGRNVEAQQVGSDLAVTPTAKTPPKAGSSSSASSPASKTSAKPLMACGGGSGVVDLCNFNPATCPIPLSLLLPPPSYEVSQNIARCLHLLGFTPGKDDPAYRAMVDSLQSMGFARGAVEWCIWKWVHQDRPKQAISGLSGPPRAEPTLPDLQFVMTWLLDHTQPAEPAPAPPAAKANANAKPPVRVQPHAQGMMGIPGAAGAPPPREPSAALAPLLGKKAIAGLASASAASSGSSSAAAIAAIGGGQGNKDLAMALAPLLSAKNKKLPSPPPGGGAVGSSPALGPVSSASAAAAIPSRSPLMARSVTTPLPSAAPVSRASSGDDDMSSSTSPSSSSTSGSDEEHMGAPRSAPLGADELSRLYAEQSASIASLKDMGFGEKHVLRALSSHHSVEASVRWLVEQQEARERRATARRRKIASRRVGGSPVLVSAPASSASASSAPPRSGQVPPASPPQQVASVSSKSASSAQSQAAEVEYALSAFAIAPQRKVSNAEPKRSPKRSPKRIAAAALMDNEPSPVLVSMPTTVAAAVAVIERKTVEYDQQRPAITISPASGGSVSMPLGPLSAPPVALDLPRLELPPQLLLPPTLSLGGSVSAPPPSVPSNAEDTALSPMLHVPSSSPYSAVSASSSGPPSASPADEEEDSDSPGAGPPFAPRSRPSDQLARPQGGSRSTSGSLLARPSAASRSTSNDLETEGLLVEPCGPGSSREDSMARTVSSRQSSTASASRHSSSVSSPFHSSSSSSVVAAASSAAARINTEAPPLLLSPQQVDSLSASPAYSSTSSSSAASASNLAYSQSNLLSAYQMQISPNPPVGSPFGTSAPPTAGRSTRNYYDESPEPVLPLGYLAATPASAILANRSTPHSRTHSPTPGQHLASSGVGLLGRPLSRLSSGGGIDSPRTEERRREELYWEEANSATYPSRRFLPPRKPTPPTMQRPVYFNPNLLPQQQQQQQQLSPSPPPRIHSASLGGAPAPSYYPSHHGSSGSSHHGSGSSSAGGHVKHSMNTWSPGQLSAAAAAAQQARTEHKASSSGQASPSLGSWQQQQQSRYEGTIHYPPPSFHHAASLPHTLQVASGRPSSHSHSAHFSSAHPPHPSLQHAASATLQHTPHRTSGSFHSHSTSPAGGLGASLAVPSEEGSLSVPGGPSFGGTGDESNSTLTRSRTTSPHPAGVSSPTANTATGTNTGTDEESESEAVIAWLRASNFGEYIPLFLHHEVSLEMVRGGEIDELDLARMGIEALGVRKKMMRAIKKEQEMGAAQQQQQNNMQMQPPQEQHYPYYSPEGGAHDPRHTPQHFVANYPPAPSPPNAHSPSESTTGSPRSASPPPPHHHQLHLPPISHHPKSDLADYHGAARTHYARERESSSSSYYPRDTSGNGQQQPQAHPMDLLHSRSQSHESLHQQTSGGPLISLSSPPYHPPGGPGLGGHHHTAQQQSTSLAHLPLHISFLQASPLLHSESPGRSHALNIEKETELVRDSLIESGRAFRVRFAVATKDNLLKMLTKGTRALHISGHGDPHHLILENALGGVEALDQTVLRNLLIVGGSDLQFVFISSCFSYRAAVAFLAAGVKHVIAVQEDTQVSDTSARAFAAHVYLALCQGRSVREAFHKGQAAVLASNNKNRSEACCCAHLHAQHCSVCDTCRSPVCCGVHAAPCHATTSCCSPTIPHGESLKFLLLPKEDAANGVNHDVRIFDDVTEGRWTDLTPAKPPNNLPSIPDHFTGRSTDAFALIQLALGSRLTTVTGTEGCGKSALARAAGTYINDRRHFEHGVFLVRCGRLCMTEDRHAAIGGPSVPASGVAINVAHELNLLISKSLNLDLFATSGGNGQTHGGHGHHGHHGHHHHGHHSSHNASLDPEVLQEALLTYLKDKHVMLILDDVDELLVNPRYRPETKSYVKTLLDATYATHLILTANLHADSSSGASSSGSLGVGVGIPGHTSKVYQLGPLHLLDSVVLLIHRFPRDLRPEEYGRMRNVQDFGEGQPIIQRLRGNPRLLEMAAELLNHLSLEQLTQMLCQAVGPSSAQSPSSPQVGSDLAHQRMAWITQQPMWITLSSEAQALIRRLVRLLESAASSVGVVTPPGDLQRGHTLSPSGSDASNMNATTGSSPAHEEASSVASSTPSGAVHAPSPLSAPVGDEARQALPPVQRTQSEPPPAILDFAGHPIVHHHHSFSGTTLPPVLDHASSSAPLPVIPSALRLPDELSDEEEDLGEDYDHAAAVLSPVSAPHGDALSSAFTRTRSLNRRSTGSSASGSSGPSASATPTAANALPSQLWPDSNAK